MRPQEHREEHRLPRRRHRFHPRGDEALEDAEEVFHKRRRRIWPWVLAGCAGGILTVALVVAIVISLAVRSISGTAQSTYTQSNQQVVQTSGNVAQLLVDDTVGNISVSTDPNVIKPTVTSVKKVKASSNDEAQGKFKQIQVQAQPTGADKSTLAVTATVPGSSGSAFGNQNESVDLTIKLPAGVQKNPSFILDITKHSVGDVVVAGLSGTLKIKSVVGNVIVHQASKLANGSLLDTGTGNLIFDGSLDTTCTSQSDGPPCYKMHAEVGKMDVTLPFSTNIFLDASTNVGKINSEFNIDVKTEGNSASYYGPLLRNPPAQPAARLVLNVGSGDINLRKA